VATMKTVEVESTLGERFTIESHIRGHKMFVDQPVAAGGQDAGPTPLEYLFLSLGACVGSIGRIVANQKRIPVRGMRVTVSGDLDVNTLMGKGMENRAGFGGITVKVDVDADLSQEEKQRFLEEVDRRCPVSDNLQRLTPVSIELV
jgi:putative redox protein